MNIKEIVDYIEEWENCKEQKVEDYLSAYEYIRLRELEKKPVRKR